MQWVPPCPHCRIVHIMCFCSPNYYVNPQQPCNNSMPSKNIGNLKFTNFRALRAAEK